MSGGIIIENTDKYTVESHGLGWAYTLTRKSDMKSAFLQDDDAAAWRVRLKAMRSAYHDPESVWHHETWNTCLSELIDEYLGD